MLDIEFPRTISYKAVGGPAFSTVVNTGLSGAEQRNQNWEFSRGKWRVSLQTPPAFERSRQQFVDLLIAFFLNVAGKANAFRLYDHLDNGPLVNAPMAVVPGTSNLQWQLQRPRTLAGYTYYQAITKPIVSYTLQDQNGNNSGGVAIVDYQGHILPNTLLSILNGNLAALPGPGTWVLDATAGIVTLAVAPSVTPPLASFRYHYPVRFDVDELPLQAEPSAVGAGRPVVSLNSVPLIEVPPPNF